MRIGLACPYTWDVPGGVQVHVRDLAETLIQPGPRGVGHHPGRRGGSRCRAYAVSAGKAMSVPYNGSVTRILMGPFRPSRVRRWVREGELRRGSRARADGAEREPAGLHDGPGPLVATYHTSNPRSRILTALQGAAAAVAGEGLGQHRGLGSRSAHHRRAPRSRRRAGSERRRRRGVRRRRPAGGLASPRPTIAFVGRIDEPRKGLAVLLEALPVVAPPARRPASGRRTRVMPRRSASRSTRRSAAMSSCSGWSAMPTSAACSTPPTSTWRPTPGRRASASCCWRRWRRARPVVASDIDAFRRVLEDGRAGRLFANEDPGRPRRGAHRGAELAGTARRARRDAGGRPSSSTTGRPWRPRSSTCTRP